MVGSAVPVSKYQIEIMYWYRDRRSGSAECTVESAYFEVIWIKKKVRIIRIHRERELKKCGWQIRNVVQVCTGVGVGLTSFSPVALLQTLADTHTHTHTHTPDHLPQGAWHYMYFVLQAWKNAFIVSE